MADLHVLILGGTGEARALAKRLVGRPHLRVTLSLAGRTRAPALPACAIRIGGFGGAGGLARYLAEEAVGALVDATHPFARTISANARAAAGAVGVPLVAVARPPWAAVPGDRWSTVPDSSAAARAIGAAPRRVLLAIGRQEVAAFREAPQHRYLVRSVEPPDPADLPPGTAAHGGRATATSGTPTAPAAARALALIVRANGWVASTSAPTASSAR